MVVNLQYTVKSNTAGVMPIIFAQALVFIPNSIGMWFENVQWLQNGMRYFNVNHPVYWVIFGLLIVFLLILYGNSI